jgi:hypothetical protein
MRILLQKEGKDGYFEIQNEDTLIDGIGVFSYFE